MSVFGHMSQQPTGRHHKVVQLRVVFMIIKQNRFVKATPLGLAPGPMDAGMAHERFREGRLSLEVLPHSIIQVELLRRSDFLSLAVISL